MLFLPVPHYVWFAFLCVLAPYVPVRHALRNLRHSYAATLLAVGIVTAFSAALLVWMYVLGVHPYTEWTLPQCAFAVLGFFLFLFLLDAAYQLYLKFYRSRLRRARQRFCGGRGTSPGKGANPAGEGLRRKRLDWPQRRGVCL